MLKALLLTITLALGSTSPQARAQWNPGAFAQEVENEFGPLSDVGRTLVGLHLRVHDGPPVHIRCGSMSVQMAGSRIESTVVVDPGIGEFPRDAFCPRRQPVGALAPGRYEFQATFLWNDGAVLANRFDFVEIVERGARCNTDPLSNQIAGTPVGMSGEAFAIAFATDAAFRARFGEAAFVSYINFTDSGDLVRLAFPPLEDQMRAMDRFERSGAVQDVSWNGVGGCFVAPPSTMATVVEFWNVRSDHYFMTGDLAEQVALDAGRFGKEWRRTEKSFPVVTRPGCKPTEYDSPFHPVYRFTGIPNVGPNSHFFTVNPTECAVVRDRKEWGWMFEGAPFWAREPKNGTCDSSTRPLYRAYNNGMSGHPNHRYATDRTTIDAMVAQGWIDEGVAMCVPR